MLKLPDRQIDKRQLNKELAALGLPGFIGVAKFSRELDKQGRAVLENGAIKKVPPYILVKCDALTKAQAESVASIMKSHTVRSV